MASHWKPWKATLTVIGTMMVFGGLETVFNLTLKVNTTYKDLDSQSEES
jgi:hypothetical protein